MEGGKRKEENDDERALVVKKQKTGEIVVAEGKQSNQLANAPPTYTRTSSMQAPIMLLTGHQSEIYSVRFSPTGKHIASASFDKSIMLWNTFGDCSNYSVMRGHQNAILEISWSTDEATIVSASADKTVQVWDAEIGQRVKKCSGHSACVNSTFIKRGPYIVSGSDDSTIKLWDTRIKGCIETLQNRFPVTSVCFSSSDVVGGDLIYSGGVDNDIKVWDWRKLKQVMMKLEGHTDTVTGIRTSPDGSYLLSNAMDNNVCIWDIRPFAQGSRLLKTFQGIQHYNDRNLLRCAWSNDGSKISAGSADRFVYIWDTTTKRILYKLPGHRGSVNDVDFHPKEPIIASASSDQCIYLGEIKP